MCQAYDLNSNWWTRKSVDSLKPTALYTHLLLSTWKIICGMCFYFSLTKKKIEYQAKKHDPFLCQASSEPCSLGCDWSIDKREAHFRPQYSSCPWRRNKACHLQMKWMCFPSQSVFISCTISLWSVIIFGPASETGKWQMRRVRNVTNHFIIGKHPSSTPLTAPANSANNQ